MVRGKKEPIFEVAKQPDPHTMENEQDRSHDPGEDLWSCGEAKTKSQKLVDLPVYHKPQEATAVWMHRNLKGCIIQVDGDHPVTPPNRLKN